MQKPGFSPDYTQRQNWQIATDLEPSDWIPTAAQALNRNNRPLLVYIGGKAQSFTSKDHNFLPGQTVAKQLIVANISRQTVTGMCEWSLALPQRLAGRSNVSPRTGEQERLPLRSELPAALAAGKYELKATVEFSTGETQHDSFLINVLPAPADSAVSFGHCDFAKTLACYFGPGVQCGASGPEKIFRLGAGVPASAAVDCCTSCPVRCRAPR